MFVTPPLVVVIVPPDQFSTFGKFTVPVPVMVPPEKFVVATLMVSVPAPKSIISVLARLRVPAPFIGPLIAYVPLLKVNAAPTVQVPAQIEPQFDVVLLPLNAIVPLLAATMPLLLNTRLVRLVVPAPPVFWKDPELL